MQKFDDNLGRITLGEETRKALEIPEGLRAQIDRMAHGQLAPTVDSKTGEEPSFPSGVARWTKDLLRNGYLVCLAAIDRRVPLAARAVAAAAVAYVASPIDLIPDAVPVVGELDDAAVAGLAVFATRRLIPAPVLADLRVKAEARALQFLRIALRSFGRGSG